VWRNRPGEGGSFDDQHRKLNPSHYIVGSTIERPNFKPTAGDLRGAYAGVWQKLIDNAAVLIAKANPTLGLARFQMVFRNRSRSENTLKGHLAHLLAALRWAKRIGLLVTIPEIDMPKRAKRSKQMKGRPITTEEFERLLGKVSQGLVEAGKDRTKKQKPQPQLRRRQVADIPAEVIESWTYYLRGLWWSGLRLEESLKLYWDRDDRLCVDLTGKFPMLRIPAELEKGHRDRLLPIAPEFAEYLFATPECERTGRVFKPMAIRPGAPLPKAHRVGEIASAIQRQRRCDDCNTGEVGERGLARLETADKTPAGWGRFQIRKFYESE
jgi:hypothetical protein